MIINNYLKKYMFDPILYMLSNKCLHPYRICYWIKHIMFWYGCYRNIYDGCKHILKNHFCMYVVQSRPHPFVPVIKKPRKVNYGDIKRSTHFHYLVCIT